MTDRDPIFRLNATLAVRYRIERKLGAGGMAMVNRAVSPRVRARPAFDVSADGERFLVGDLSAEVTRLGLVSEGMTEVRRRLDS